MRRSLLFGLALLTLASASPLQAGDPCNSCNNGCGGAVKDKWHYFWYTVDRDFKRMNSWPDPFVYPDRQSVCNPLQMQVRNGWRMQNLMGEYYFSPDTQQLTVAGRERVRYILTQVPAQHRSLFVQRGTTAEITAARMDAVQKAASMMVAQGELPPVVDTDLSPRGWPADYINTVYGSFEKTTPAPRLPAAAAGSSGGQ